MKLLAKREAALIAGEKAITLRELAAARYEDALRLREETALNRSEPGALGALVEAQLREANENLIVATIRAQAMTEAAEGAAAEMTHMASHDVLTGLPNRALLTDRLAQSIGLAQRKGHRVALLYLDLDHFKNINDSLGHTVGDQLLQAVATRLKACVRLSDTVCRQGGDEFVVLLAEIDSVNDAVLTAGKLIEAMAESFVIKAQTLHVSVSIGVSLFPDDGRDIEALLKNADTAMYHAKKNGRNNYQLFAPDMNVRAVARQSVEMAMRQALEQSRLVLHYQPKVNLETGAITGAEALVRLQASGLPLMHPAHFVSVAEDCGLIVPIGKWVLQEACRQTVEWLKSGMSVSQVAVNVSAVEFHGKDFLAGVRAVLNDTGMDPCHLELELTESGLMQDTQRTIAVLHALKEMGIRIAIDDFGTGYSSLSYLRRFPIHSLKVDQSFVQDIHAGSGDVILVDAIIAMGKSLKLGVVAEGIETLEQVRYLRSRHCTEGQGYYFGRPMESAEFAVLLASGLGKMPCFSDTT